jgi:hypothetical protein
MGETKLGGRGQVGPVGGSRRRAGSDRRLAGRHGAKCPIGLSEVTENHVGRGKV